MAAKHVRHAMLLSEQHTMTHTNDMLAADEYLGNERETPALRFGSHQDALDFARHGVEDANRRLAAQSLNAIDSLSQR
jgi:hypothetical protein